VNLRRHREYFRQLTAWIDVRARWVLNEMLAQLGIEAGFECRHCHRNLALDPESDFTFVCQCGHCRVFLASQYWMHRAATGGFEREQRQFQEEAA